MWRSPFGLSKNASPEKKEKGLIAEINNGRLAQLGMPSEHAMLHVHHPFPFETRRAHHAIGFHPTHVAAHAIAPPIQPGNRQRRHHPPS